MDSELPNTTMEPEELTFQLLREITDGFSEERRLGAGAYGVVYKGVTKNGEDVAVKKLRDANPNLDDKQFQNEFYNLRMLKHKNIVQVLGYCYETMQVPADYNGKIVLAEMTHRALCFEYLHNGSLQNHLSDEFCGLDWHTRYKIIKGTCEGLKYIHEELKEPLYHLDIKPDNILLDMDMVPKIADFGLSRIFGKELTRTTQSPIGTLGYQPPEFIERGEISKKFDIFSLGMVMIKIVSGPEGHSKCADMPHHEFMNLVQKNWRNRLQRTWNGCSLEAYCHQVERCTQIALNCVEKESDQRLNILEIIDKLNEIENCSGKEGCCKTVSGMVMHSKMTKMRKEPKEITDQQEHFDLIKSSRCNELEFVDIREESSDIEERHIVGRTDIKKKIVVSLLQNMAQKIIILPIYGIGGIGKTTLAKLIYDDTNFKFYSRVWVYVSQRFDLNKIRNSIILQLSKKESQNIRDSIILQLSKKESQNTEGQMIHNYLQKLLCGKKVLIVLDDLWEDNPFQLENLKAMLNFCESITTIVVVTTRSERIAERICINLKPYKIESLTNDMCWDIIRQRSDFEARDDKEQLMNIGREIALKCGGVALAAQSLGFMLRSMKSDQWIKVKDSNIWNKDASLPNDVLASLKLSYTSMPECLRLCFAYCAIFPKGHRIVKDDLFQQWISLGFIKPTKILSTMQLCEKYIVQLLGLSFLQHSVSANTVGAYDKGVTEFTMHDLVHDLARFVMVDELLDASKQGTTCRSKCQYALLTDCSKPLESATSSPDRIRALRFLDCGQIELHGDALSSAKSIQVLDLSECCILNLPASIGKLVHLRYLNAKKIQSIMIPDCFTELSKLIYLNLSSSRMSALPGSIGEIKGLMYLNISNCSEIRELPESFVNLKKLVHLDLSNCRQLTCVSKALGGLTNIQYLNLSLKANRGNKLPLDGLPEVIGDFIELRYLDLSWTMQSIFRTPGSSTNEIFSFFDCICNLSNLEHLDLSNNLGIVSVPESIGRLRKLHTLHLWFCIQLVSLPDCIIKMDSLKILNVTGCSKLDRSILSRSKIFALLPHFVVHADHGESISNICLLRHVNPNDLHISSLENVKSAEEVQSIKLIEKKEIRDLKLEWTINARRSVEDVDVLSELVPPSSLMKFNMQGYSSVMFPAWVMGVTFYLPELTTIVLYEIHNCNSLPPLGQLPNLQVLVLGGMLSLTTIEEDFCGGARAFRRLIKFQLCHMENLEVWNTVYSYGEDNLKEFMFPNLVQLLIRDCPKLRLNPCHPRAKEWVVDNSDNVLSSGGEGGECASSSAAPTDVKVRVKFSNMPLDQWRILHQLPNITYLSISCCTNLTCSSPEIIGDLSSVKLLLLEDNAQPELSKWLGDLISLRKLSIRGWTELSDLQMSMRHLGSLQELSLYKCPKITGLPEWLGDLASLEKFAINNCRGIKSLPESIQNLTKLEELIIYDCPELVEWCTLSENKKKLAHIKLKRIF